MVFKLYSSILIISILLTVLMSYPLAYALFLGLVLFIYDAYKKGFIFREILNMLGDGLKTVKNMVLVFAMIGIVTAAWRVSGTVPYLVYYGAKLINPKFFYLFAYLLTLAMSMLLGSVNGTVTTMGVVLVSLAYANGANLLITVGAILSGGMFGDRASPVSSSATLVADLTKTDININLKKMLKTSIIPGIITGLVFLFISLLSTEKKVELSFLNEIREVTGLSHLSMIPALSIIILSLFKLDTKKLLIISSIISIIIGSYLYRIKILEITKYLLLGFEQENISEKIGRITNGGGLISMKNIILNVGISSMYFGIFKKTHFLEPLKKMVDKLEEKTSTYTSMIIMSILFSIVFCTQALVVMVAYDIYEKKIEDPYKLMLALEDIAILVPALIPWNLAANTIFTLYEISYLAVIFNIYCMTMPLYHCLKLSKNKGLSIYNR